MIPVECREVQARWSEWLDLELDAEMRAVVESHLRECAGCRGQADAWRLLDADLRRLTQPDRESAARVAEGTLDAWRQESSPAVQAPRRFDTWPRLLLAFAAGFLLAMAIYRPWQGAGEPSPGPAIVERPSGGESPSDPAPNAAEASLVRLVLATGAVETREPGATDWAAVGDARDFRCGLGTAVRTGVGVRCELETVGGCTIRVDQQAELAVRGADELELRRGVVWCRQPQEASLRIVSAAAVAPPEQAPAWSCACPSNSVVLTELREPGTLRIQSAGGDVELASAQIRRTVRAGQEAEVVDGRLTLEPRYSDALLATSWMHDLLVRRGHTDQELNERVDRLLAQVGRSKIANLYEDEIRSLGDYAALPLLRFVESAASRNEPSQRLAAMRVLADVAPTWLISDLIERLADEDPQVRVLAALALRRLTGYDQERPPADWTAPVEECAESLAAWRRWWRTNQHRFPRPGSIPRIPTST